MNASRCAALLSKLRVSASLALTVVLLISLLATGASAQTVPPPEGPGGMDYTGIDSRVARLHGYKVFTLRDGTRASVSYETLKGVFGIPSDLWIMRRAAATHNGTTGVTTVNGRVVSGGSGDVSTQTTLEGDCGYSWLYVDDVGTLIADVWLGFYVNYPAVSYDAGYVLSADEGAFASYSEYGGGLAFRNDWSHHEFEGVPLPDDYVGEVQYMNAYFASGLWCSSLLPADVEYVD